MKYLIFFVGLLLLSNTYVQAKSLDQKKDELKKIYEAGGISKIEYEKANKFLTQTGKKKNAQKQSLALGKKKSKKTKDKDKPILDEDLNLIEIYDKQKFQTEFLKYPPEVIKYFGKDSNVLSRAKKAGKFMSLEFSRSEQGQQRFPGRMIKAMAAFEIFYIDSLRKNKKSLLRYKEKKGQKYFKKKLDESSIRSLISLNKGREKMRKALGMDLDTPRKEAIKKFWYLGEFLDLGKALKNEKYEKGLDERKKLLIAYKQKISLLKEKIKDEQKKETIN